MTDVLVVTVWLLVGIAWFLGEVGLMIWAVERGVRYGLCAGLWVHSGKGGRTKAWVCETWEAR